MIKSRRRAIPSRLAFRACLRAFGEAASKALVPTHKESHLREIEYCPDSEYFIATLSEPARDLVILRFNQNMLLTEVLPHPDLKTPYHSKDFYETYWEPVVYTVGHYYLPQDDVVIVPKHANSRRRKFSGFYVREKAPSEILVEFSHDTWKNTTWKLKPVKKMRRLIASPTPILTSRVKRDSTGFIQGLPQIVS